MSAGEDPGLGPRKRGTIPKKDTLINVAGFHCIATYLLTIAEKLS